MTQKSLSPRESEEALRQSEERLRLVTDAAELGLWTWHPDGDRISWDNDRIYDIIGISRTAAPITAARFAAEFVNPDDRAAFEQAIADTVQNGARLFYQGRFHRHDGALCWVEFTGVPVQGPDGVCLRVIGTIQDITKPKQAEDVLRQHSAQFETLINEAPLGVVLIDADFRIRQVNPTALPAYGDMPELIGRDFADVLHILLPKAQADEVIQQFRHTLETGESCLVPEMIGQRVDSPTTEYYEWRINRIPLPDGRHGVVCYFRDISQRVLAQQKIRDSEERYRNLFNSIDEGFCVIEMIFDGHQKPVDWRYLEVNPAFVTLTGIHDIVGKRIRELVPDQEAYWFEIYGKVVQTGEAIRFVNEAKGLEDRWFDLYAFRLGGPDSRKVAVLFTNITARKQAEQALDRLNAMLEQRVLERTAELSQANADLQAAIAAKERLRESQERLLTVAENLNEGLVITSMEGEFIHWNRASLAMHGFASMAEGMGQVGDFTKLVEIEALDGAALAIDQWPMSRALRGEQVRNRELRIRRTDTGVERILSYSGNTVRDSAGKRSAFLIVTDITERKRDEAQLRELNDTLEQRVLERTQALGESERRQKRATDAAVRANQAKSDFLSTISHEIRTPLNGMLGMTELLLMGHLNPRQRRYAELAQASGQTLLALVNDLLDIGKIEAGRLDVEHIPFSLTELLSELTDLYTLRAHEKSLVFLAKKAPDVPDALLGDPGHLRQILNNLLANALKFTQQGEIGLSVQRLDDDGLTCRLRFSVHDSGIGIAPEMQPSLFTRFTQVNGSSTSENRGSGLGLAIVKQLCEHLGGEVALASTPGQGSVFSCDLPFAEVTQTVPVPVPVSVPVAGPVLSQARILLAEDNPTNQLLAQALLEQIGYAQVTVVGNGQEAVNAVLTGGFDLVLMDCRMPVLDGYDATLQIRARGCLLPIIAMTANAAFAERDKCLNLGMNDYISKPFNIATLRQALARWIP